MKESKHGCKNCSQITLHFSYCDYRCSRKGNKRKLPNKITQKAIKEVIENNVGIYINQNKVSIYQREVRGLLNIA